MHRALRGLGRAPLGLYRPFRRVRAERTHQLVGLAEEDLVQRTADRSVADLNLVAGRLGLIGRLLRLDRFDGLDRFV
ncbi:MAG TPA: hypothetical protein VK047_07310, partial [Zeimonas sp.]|nr:hypothetical protein [Zeimonas sp.]